jgi:succinate dehydrogenase/fumarate reductase flavoprotein subunit
MNTEHFQNLIIGSGVAGKILTWTLASQGQKTVVVERAMVVIWTHATMAEGLLGLFSNPPSAHAPESSISNRSVNRGRPVSMASVTAKE